MRDRKRSSGHKRRGYHHGNLREALIEAALDLITEVGPAGFSFAEVTRAVGVSPGAPYRHFRDRDALMAAIAQRGFERFTDKLEAAWDEGRPNARGAFMRTGQAYLAFARAEPAYYAAMFEARLPPDTSLDLARAADRASGVLRQASEALIADLPEARRPPALMMSLHIWAQAHGIASLFARGDAGRRKLPMTPEDLLEASVLIYLRGLGLDPDS